MSGYMFLKRMQAETNFLEESSELAKILNSGKFTNLL
jgi:hypothetical protein